MAREGKKAAKSCWSRAESVERMMEVVGMCDLGGSEQR